MANDSPIDETAFEAVVHAHRGIIFRVVRGYCRDPEERADLAQEIVLQLWRSFGNYDSQAKLSTWIYRVALNVAISAHRRLNVRRRHVVSADEQRLSLVESDGAAGHPDPALEKLTTFIHELDPLTRALMTMYLDGTTHREISEVLGISESNVGTKIGRLKQRLETHLGLGAGASASASASEE